MLLLGMVASSLVFGVLLADFKQVKLIQVIQGAALLTMVLNMVALWKQEARNPSATAARANEPRPRFRDSWRAFTAGGRASRLLVTVGIGTAAFSMQDILLEPYGGQIMNLPVSDTSSLTALMAGGALAAFALASRWLHHGGDPYRLAAMGTLAGVAGFGAVIFADPMRSAMLFRFGAILIGFGGGFFSVATLTAAMGLQTEDHNGLALGAWGAVQATAGGLAIAVGGGLRDVISALAEQGALGSALCLSHRNRPAVCNPHCYGTAGAVHTATPVAGISKVWPGRVAGLRSWITRREPWKLEPSPDTSTSRKLRCTCSGYFLQG
jgi:BCD family chlorophyll transporter-like MFS transporter